MDTVKDIVGRVSDNKRDIIFRAYTQGTSQQQTRDCVELVKLPREEMTEIMFAWLREERGL
ncbi:MAG: hypothetical protein EON58_15110 [Alphaproteobacteria bacterium]|nr:MAG: hypothetical protein EON58_15110 [Alphaproteobacteria bacterium]